MEMILILLVVFVPASIRVGYILWKRHKTPTLIKYVNLLHKYQTPNHWRVEAMFAAGDETFQRRVRALNHIWNLKTNLPNYHQHLSAIRPEHHEAFLEFIDTSETDNAEFEHELNTNPAYQQAMDDVMYIQCERIRLLLNAMSKEKK